MQTVSNDLVQFLAQQGMSREEIQSVVGKMKDYDRRTISDSVFAMIADQAFDPTPTDE